ncbi:hypothetical protein KFE25_003698 [Diacronema lutheri]|uniref:Uncharacterized protein n=2 Tax=Diacronema lutheri TaxID=2081491 RepID=A0A8J5XBL3_DIALT|nr:hypothetical protein KFE25_003698 [Diacronema lutheri]
MFFFSSAKPTDAPSAQQAMPQMVADSSDTPDQAALDAAPRVIDLAGKSSSSPRATRVAGFGASPPRRPRDEPVLEQSPALGARSRDDPSLRTLADVEAAIRAAETRAHPAPILFPSDLPTRSWLIVPSEDETTDEALERTVRLAIDDVQNYCKDITTGALNSVGGHSVRKCGGIYPPGGARLTAGRLIHKGHGMRRRLVCSFEGQPASTAIGEGAGRQRKRGSARCRCGFRVWLEHVHGHVAIMELSHFKHNGHELATTTADKAASAAMRDPIPPHVFEEALVWAARIPLSSVVHVLKDKAEKATGQRPDWTVKDFANKRARGGHGARA